MAIDIGDIHPLTVLHPFTGSPLLTQALVLTKNPDGSPRKVRTITGEPDLDRVVGPAGDANVTQEATLTLGVSGVVNQMLDEQRLYENYAGSALTTGVITVPAGAFRYVPLAGGNTSEDLVFKATTLQFGDPLDQAAATQPADGTYFAGATISLTSTAGSVIVTAQLRMGLGIDTGGEVATTANVFYKRVTAIGEPESIPILASLRIGQNNREVGIRISHDQVGSVDFDILAGQFFTRQQSKE